MIDLYSGYSWQGGAKADTGINAAALVEAVIDAIEERWDITLPACTIRSDNGAAYTKDHERAYPCLRPQDVSLTLEA